VEKADDSNKQEIANKLARLSILACSRLGGYLVDKDSDMNPPDNPAVKKSLMALLTPYLSRKLANPDPAEVTCIIHIHSVP